MIVTKTGFPITYSITNPGVHDVKVLETLSEEANLPNILGDKGYTSHKIHEKLEAGKKLSVQNERRTLNQILGHRPAS